MAVASHRYYFGQLAGVELLEVLTALANGAAQANAAWLRRHPEAPRLDNLRPTYTKPPAAGGDRSCQGIALAPVLLVARRGSCLDFACYHAGWIAARRSLPATVELVPGSGALHALVRTDDDVFDVTEWVSRETAPPPTGARYV